MKETEPYDHNCQNRAVRPQNSASHLQPNLLKPLDLTDCKAAFRMCGFGYDNANDSSASANFHRPFSILICGLVIICLFSTLSIEMVGEGRTEAKVDRFVYSYHLDSKRKAVRINNQDRTCLPEVNSNLLIPNNHSTSDSFIFNWIHPPQSMGSRV